MSDLTQLVKTLKAAVDIRRYNRADFFEPYPKQEAFFDLGATKDERLLMAANQVGKSWSGAYEAACHLTGNYPDWWLGKRFDKPTRGWICGETGLVVRDVSQKMLCGEPGVIEAFGSGFIPKDSFVAPPTLARGTPSAYDTIQVRHVSGGVSIARFKTYEQGRERFQGESLDWIWFDEEPKMEIYSEGITRLNATHGISWMTFTPLQGMSEVVMRFLQEVHANRGVVTMTIDDVKHFDAKQKADIISKYQSYEIEARTKGIPMLGSGRIFPYSEASITEARINAVPLEWFKGWGVDFGIDHPFAAVLLAFDRDTDTIHVLHTIRVSDQKPLQHAAAMKPIGIRVPVFWPHDGHGRESSGETVASLYKKEGLRTWPEHSTHPQGGYSTEAGIMEMQARMETGRLKVADHLSDFFEEFRLYHRKNGDIVKLRDDIMSATRVGIMMRRHFKQVALGGEVPKGRRNKVARGVDFPLF